MYPGHIKMVFLSLFLSQLLANYVVVQRWIFPRDIIKEVSLTTVTSCIMKCSRIDKCTAVVLQKDPGFVKNDKCLLVKMLRKKDKNRKRIKIFALVEEQTAVEDEKKERRLALAKQEACPVDVNGGYGNWSNFTVCTKSCGTGLQYRNRSCDNPTPMIGGRNCSMLGNANEERSCNNHLCPIDGGFGAWSSYGTCSKTCGTGEQQRNRSCDTPLPQHGGKDCTSLGTSTERRSCNTNSCPPVYYGIGWFVPDKDFIGKCSTSLSECFKFCDNVRKSNGIIYNGISYCVPNANTAHCADCGYKTWCGCYLRQNKDINNSTDGRYKSYVYQ